MARTGNSFKLSRDKDHQKALFRNLTSALIINERIKTTEAKAKALKSFADRVVNKAKKSGTRTREQLTSYLTSSSAVDKLYDDIVKRFSDRSGGYTRIVRIGTRRGDNTMMMLVEWVKKGEQSEVSGEEKEIKETSEKKTVKEKKDE